MPYGCLVVVWPWSCHAPVTACSTTPRPRPKAASMHSSLHGLADKLATGGRVSHPWDGLRGDRPTRSHGRSPGTGITVRAISPYVGRNPVRVEAKSRTSPLVVAILGTGGASHLYEPK